MMGGQLWVESEPGMGSTFHFTAEFGEAAAGTGQQASETESQPVLQPQAFGPLRVLVAEDNQVNRQLAVRLLEKRGHTTAIACDGREALAVLEQQRFDLVLMDVQMPVMDGLEVARVIRARERTTGDHMPIIATTAHAMKGDEEQCLEAGMDAYVSKPISAFQLFTKIEQVVCSRHENLAGLAGGLQRTDQSRTSERGVS